MARWQRSVDPVMVATLAELDQLVSELRARGLTDWAAHAERTIADAATYGADSVVLLRLSCYRKVLEAAQSA